MLLGYSLNISMTWERPWSSWGLKKRHQKNVGMAVMNHILLSVTLIQSQKSCIFNKRLRWGKPSPWLKICFLNEMSLGLHPMSLKTEPGPELESLKCYKYFSLGIIESYNCLSWKRPLKIIGSNGNLALQSLLLNHAPNLDTFKIPPGYLNNFPEQPLPMLDNLPEKKCFLISKLNLH